MYYKAFQMTNDKKNKGDITPFVIIFLGFIQQAVDNLNTVLANKIEQMQFYHKGILKAVKEEKTRDLCPFSAACMVCGVQ